jgi:hypothetical protein
MRRLVQYCCLLAIITFVLVQRTQAHDIPKKASIVEQAVHASTEAIRREFFDWNPISQFDHRLVEFLDQLSNMTEIMNKANSHFSVVVGTAEKGEDHLNQRINELNQNLVSGIQILDKNWKSTSEQIQLIFKYAGNILIFGCFIFLMTFIVSPLFISPNAYFPKIIEKLHYIALILLPVCFPFWIFSVRNRFDDVFGPCAHVVSICLGSLLTIFSFFIVINSIMTLILPPEIPDHEDLDYHEKPTEKYRIFHHYQKFAWMYEGLFAMVFMVLGAVLFI